MRNLAITVVLTALTIVVLFGCASPTPSPEQQTRESDQQRDAERQQAEFRKGLPPVSNPGRGW
jgi:outer membrane biogenesis lipoprotein LolB